MPSFMPIELKLWALEGYTQTNKQTDRGILIIYIDIEEIKKNYKDFFFDLWLVR